MEPYEQKDFSNLLGIEGFSEQLLQNHFKLYEGYVKNFNALNDTLVKMEREGLYGTLEYAELNRRFGWEFNGMRLHELYFGNMVKGGRPLSNLDLAKVITDNFGSLESWEKDFRAMGAMRGIGWVVLYYDRASNKLFNVWINEHDAGHFAGCVPLLVMDVFEHAYMADYGLKKAEYVNNFLKIVDWTEVEKRFLGPR